MEKIYASGLETTKASCSFSTYIKSPVANLSYSMLSETWANGDPLLPGSVKLSSLHISQCEWRTLPSDTLPRLSSVLVVLSSQTAFHHHRRCLQ